MFVHSGILNCSPLKCPWSFKFRAFRLSFSKPEVPSLSSLADSLGSFRCHPSTVLQCDFLCLWHLIRCSCQLRWFVEGQLGIQFESKALHSSSVPWDNQYGDLWWAILSQESLEPFPRVCGQRKGGCAEMLTWSLLSDFHMSVPSVM